MADRPRMQPVFEIPLASNGEDVLRRLDALLEADGGGLIGQVLPRHAVLHLPPERQSLLSPFLNLELLDDDRRTVLRGRFSPHPNIWTGFIAAYGALFMVGLLSTMYGLSQWWMGAAPWGLLGAPAAIGVVAFVYGAAVIGQGLTADEMYDLRALVDRAVRESGRV